MTEHAWADSVGMYGMFGYKGHMHRLNVFADGLDNIPAVGRLCFLSLINGNGVKLRVRGSDIFEPPKNFLDE